MNDLLAQARAFFESLSVTQRTGLLTAFLVSIFVVGGVVWWSSTESYDLIMVGDSVELRKAAEQLDEAGIPYRYEAASDLRPATDSLAGVPLAKPLLLVLLAVLLLEQAVALTASYHPLTRRTRHT